MSALNIDVLIVGGGPAGSSAALSILKHSKLSVLIIEKSNLQSMKVGESVSSSIFELLNYIDINNLDPSKSIANYTTFASWGTSQLTQQHSIFSTLGGNFQLNRHYFDNFLISEVDKRGGYILPETKIVNFEKKDFFWEITARNQQDEFKIIAKYLIDATGRNRSLARKLMVKQKQYDDLTAIGTFLKFKSKNLVHQTLMETIEDGWFYTSTLPENILNLTFFSSAEIIKNNNLNNITNFNYLISKTKHIKKLLDSEYENSAIWGRSASSNLLFNPNRTDYIAVGDAVASFDPISSLGIGFAFSSGLNAAKCIIDFENSLIEDYHSYYNYIEATFINYLSTKEKFYSQEKRWRKSSFWRNYS